MKLSVVAVAAVFALSSPAFAQSGSSDTFSSDGLNGAMLGKSMRGVNNGVPYPNPATDGSARVGGGWRHGDAAPRRYRHHHHYKHYRHYRHH
jgi:hypothetical protein